MKHYLVPLAAVAVISAAVLFTANKSKDNFCTCQGMDKKVCPKTETLKSLYNAGILTEYSDFAKLQGTPQWSK